MSLSVNAYPSHFGRTSAGAIWWWYGETLRTGRWQNAPLGAHEEGIGEDISQPRKHPARGRLRVAEARRRTRNVRSSSSALSIGHGDNRKIKVRLDHSPELG